LVRDYARYLVNPLAYQSVLFGNWHLSEVLGMPKNVNQRVEDSFTTDDPNVDNREDMSKYMDWLLPTMQSYTQNMRRMATAILLLIAVFEFVAHSRSIKLSVESFPISRGSVVFNILPVVVAYLALQIITDVNKADRLNWVFTAVFKRWSPSAGKNDLDKLLYAPESLYWSWHTKWAEKENMYASDNQELIASRVLSVGLLLGVLAFEADAYYVLFSSTQYSLWHVRYLLWAISLGCTSLCLIMGVVALRASNTK
jgi:hypothetical protein